MKDDVMASHRLLEQPTIEDVAFDEAEARVALVGGHPAASAGSQVVEGRDLVTLREQAIYSVTPYEACTTRDQIPHG
jgi:hypothetical protein